MDFSDDPQFNPGDYVTAEQFAQTYPEGARGAVCRYCGALLIVPTGEDADCGRHRN